VRLLKGAPPRARWSASLRVLLVYASMLIAALSCCGGTAHLRAQGAAISDVPDADPSRYARKKPVLVLVGSASYYADSLAGNHTASGEVYDPSRRTAASRDLPFGTVVRVIRRDSGRSVLVRINDRGPFANRKRILDLSRAAAEELDMIDSGVVKIRAEVLELGKKKRKR
jgi:rare lipoprotein A